MSGGPSAAAPVTAASLPAVSARGQSESGPASGCWSVRVGGASVAAASVLIRGASVTLDHSTCTCDFPCASSTFTDTAFI